MDGVFSILEQLASDAVLADPTDLNALATLHTHFEALTKQLAECGTSLPGAEAATGTCGKARQIVESIVLRETQDAQGALNSIRTMVAEIQQALDGATVAQTPTPAPAPVNTTPAVAAPAANALEESAIKADDVPLVRDFITEANGHIETAEAELLKIEQSPEDKGAIDAVFRGFHTVKGVAGFLGLKQIGQLAHGAESILDMGRKGMIQLAGEPIELVLQSVDMLKALLGSLEHALRAGSPPAMNPDLPVLLAKFQNFHAGGGAKSATPAPVAPAVAATPAIEAAPVQEQVASAPVTEAPKPAAAESAPKAAALSDATVKVSTERLDRLVNAVGELVIAQAMVQQNMAMLWAGGGAAASGGNNSKLGRNVSQLGKITRELQDLAMAMRMVPIQSVFQKMGRIVRDIAKKTGKQIELIVEGGETELDRNLVEAISDPLVHMIRNAADHGLEMPDVRQKTGKSPIGKILLRACHQSGNVLIEIRDDGKGLDKKRILQKAIQTGIVKAGQELADADIFRLIFAAGLSTAEKVTDVSGRGVGMDVVKRNVEALRGRIDITSEEGKGTSFVIRLPLTLAVIDGLLVRVGNERYILPITSVEQTVKPTAAQISTVQNHGEVLNLRGRLLPLYRLASVFSIAGQTDATKALVIVVQENERRFGLLVDDLLGQHQVVIKSLGQGIGHVKGVSGAAILGDGTVSLILDVPGLHESAGARAFQGASA